MNPVGAKATTTAALGSADDSVATIVAVGPKDGVTVQWIQWESMATATAAVDLAEDAAAIIAAMGPKGGVMAAMVTIMGSADDLRANEMICSNNLYFNDVINKSIVLL